MTAYESGLYRGASALGTTGFRLSRAKNIGSDSDQGGALGNRGLKIRGHSHGQGIQGRVAFLQSGEHFMQLGKYRALFGWIGRRRGYCHQAAQAEVGERGDFYSQCCQLFRRGARLGRFVGQFDLQTNVQGRQGRIPLIT